MIQKIGSHAASVVTPSSPFGHGPAGTQKTASSAGNASSSPYWPVPSRSVSRTLLMVAGLPLLTQIIGSIFNIWYNTVHVTPFLVGDQIELFTHTIFLFNITIYPVLTGIWLLAVAWLYRPLSRLGKGETLPQPMLEKAQRRAVHLPWWFLAVTAAGWVLCIPSLLVPLMLMAESPLDPRLLTHLPISIAIAGMTSVSQGVFVVELTTERWLYSRLFQNAAPSESAGVHPLSLRGRGILWLVTAAVCPVFSLLLLVLGADNMGADRLFAGAVSIMAVGFALVSAWLMSRLLVEPVEKLRLAAQSVATGDLDVQIDLLRADEFGPLIQEFNVMVAELREQERLKRQIAERTHDLEVTTTQLETEAQQRQQVTNHLRSALSSAENASRAKTEFLANMSHELRTPLSAILGFAEILQDDGLPQDSRQEFTSSIEKSGRHLLHIINDLLDLTAIQSGKLPVAKADCGPREILQEVVELLSVKAEQKGLAIRCEIEADVPSLVHTDALRLRQALVNLVGNATKFTEEGSITVRVSSIAEGRLVRFDIEDTGPGIAEDQLERTQNAIKIINERVKNNNKDFLWLGSAGLIHKGLDLLLDYFSEHSDIRLHIAGDIYRESNFVEAYKNELNSKNIIVHHFVDIDSIQFEDILKQCAFTLLPSCSEGGSPSVLTAIGNGGLIPIISKETTVSTGNEIWIDTLDKKGITEAVKQALSMDNETLAQHYHKNCEYAQSHHSQEAYYNTLKNNITTILNHDN